MSSPKVTPTPIPGLLTVHPDVQYNEDGWFKENWHRAKMVALGMPDFRPVQHNVTHVATRGVTRGFLAEPWDRMVSVVAGKAMGAWVDLRPGAGFGRTWTCYLDPGTSMFVPRGVGNAHQVLVDGTTFNYLMEHHWTPQVRPRSSTVDLFDPDLGIPWQIPREQAILSHQDRFNPPLSQAAPIRPRSTLIVGTETRLGRALLAEMPHASGLTTSQLAVGAESKVDLSAFDTIINAHGDTSSGLSRTPGLGESWADAAARAQLLTQIAHRNNLRYVHISADCVFDRDVSAHPADEPLSLHHSCGQKLAAGELIAATVPRHLVVRTGWVVERARGFLDDITAAAKRGQQIEVCEDERGRLTFASQLADGITHLLNATAPAGTYNITGDGRVATWGDWAREIYRLCDANPGLVVGVATQGHDAVVGRTPAILDLDKAKQQGWRPGNSWFMLADQLAGRQEDSVAGVPVTRGPITGRPTSEPQPVPTETAHGRPYRVLFVCTGNIARSAYAAARSQHVAPPGVEFSSAGTGAVVGGGIDPPMLKHLADRGVPDGHQARQLAREMVEQADLVLVMGTEHRRYILDAWPTFGRKTFVIGQAAREMIHLPQDVTLQTLVDHLWRHRTPIPGDDVPDPHRRGAAAAAEASRLIDERLDVILPTLTVLAGRRNGAGRI